jgi:glycosyltransferase involved in cell wall biosynthesis
VYPTTLLYNKVMASQPFFSVIIPAFNRRDFLKKAVSSVLCQTCGDLELIVIDDGSTDGTSDAIHSFDDIRLKYIYKANEGVSSARNKGLEMARGRFIAFLDSDDRWTKEKLETAERYIREHPGIEVFHTEEIWYKNGRLLSQKQKHAKPSGHVYRKAIPLCCISISTAVIKKTVLDEIGHFDETLKACEDYDLWLRVTSRYEVKLIPEQLTIKDGGRPDQLSSNIWGLDRFRIKALEKMLGSGCLSEKDREATRLELVKKCGIFAAGCEKRGKAPETKHYRGLAEKYASSRAKPYGLDRDDIHSLL